MIRTVLMRFFIVIKLHLPYTHHTYPTVTL
nr:MAG TPA: hypothetical protein [Caudoviricetes sp.]